jgi:hypothetical protein
MRERRADDARRYPNVLAACLLAWAEGEEGIDRDAAAIVVAETILGVRAQVIKG